jgi:glycine cleavage system H protein
MKVRYTAEHEWVAVDGNVATVGITDHAQNALGDLVFVQLPEVGASLARGAVAGVVESVKAASDIFAPLTGRIVEVNTKIVADPGVVNADPAGAGWLFKIQYSNAAEWDQLLDESAYRQITHETP